MYKEKSQTELLEMNSYLLKGKSHWMGLISEERFQKKVHERESTSIEVIQSE